MIIIVLFSGYCLEGFVQCFVDPYRTSWCPIGTTCVSNYCGGCKYDCSKFIINFAFNFLWVILREPPYETTEKVPVSSIVIRGTNTFFSF